MNKRARMSGHRWALWIAYEPAAVSRKCQSAFVLSFWVNEKKRLASLSVVSQRATKRASRSLADTETELEGHGNGATTRVAERCRSGWVGSRRDESRGGVVVCELEWLGAVGMKSECTPVVGCALTRRSGMM